MAMVGVSGPADILHYRPHRYANSSLDKPPYGSFLRHYGMDFAVTPCHNHAYSYKRPSNRDIASISTNVDGYCFAIISDFCASIIESGTVIYHRLSKKRLRLLHGSQPFSYTSLECHQKM